MKDFKLLPPSLWIRFAALGIVSSCTLLILSSCGGSGSPTYTVSGRVSGLNNGSFVSLQNNGIDTLNIAANGTFIFPTALKNGSSYNVTVSSQPTPYICRVTNGSGAYVINVTNVLIRCSPQYPYVVNNTGNSLTQFAIGIGGALSTSATVSSTLPNSLVSPFFIAIDSSGQYAYVTNSNLGVNTVSQFTIGTGGALTPMADPAVLAGPNPQAIAANPASQNVYVANFDFSTITQYSIGTTGGLSPMPSPIVATGNNPSAIAITPNGKNAYVSNSASNTLSQYSVGPTGALSSLPVGAIPTGQNPHGIAITPNGKYLYVANKGANLISQYTISTTGALIPMSVTSVNSGSNPIRIAIEPTGKYLYVTNNGAASVSQYSIGSSGALSALSIPTVPTGTNPYDISVDGTGNYVYVTNSTSNTISEFSISVNGALTQIGSTASSGGSPIGLAIY